MPFFFFPKPVLAVPVLPVMPVVPAGQACPVFAVLLVFKYTQLTLYPV